jgi:hypothetical protein
MRTFVSLTDFSQPDPFVAPFPICNLAFINMFLNNSNICFLVVLLVDSPEDYC